MVVADPIVSHAESLRTYNATTSHINNLTVLRMRDKQKKMLNQEIYQGLVCHHFSHRVSKSADLLQPQLSAREHASLAQKNRANVWQPGNITRKK